MEANAEDRHAGTAASMEGSVWLRVFLAARYTAFEEQTRHARYMQIALAAICAPSHAPRWPWACCHHSRAWTRVAWRSARRGMMCVCLWLLGADDGYNGMMRKVVLATAASPRAPCGSAVRRVPPRADARRWNRQGLRLRLAQALLSGWMFAKPYKARHNDAVRARRQMEALPVCHDPDIRHRPRRRMRGRRRCRRALPVGNSFAALVARPAVQGPLPDGIPSRAWCLADGVLAAVPGVIDPVTASPPTSPAADAPPYADSSPAFQLATERRRHPTASACLLMDAQAAHKAGGTVLHRIRPASCVKPDVRSI